LIGEDQVELPPGKTVIGFRHSIDKPAMYTYHAASWRTIRKMI